MKPLIIAVDFDGTCVTHEFPNVGKQIGAVPVLLRLVKAGHKLILYTMRSNTVDTKLPDGNHLDAAINWFKENEIELLSVNFNPTQAEWTSSPKCYAQLYIDDAALGAPLKRDEVLSERAFIDWESVEATLEIDGVLDPTNEFIAAMREDMKNAGQKSNFE